MTQPWRPSCCIAGFISWRSLRAFKGRVTMAMVTAKPVQVGHQQRIRSPELRGLVDGESAAPTLKAGHTLVDQHPGDVAFSREPPPDG